MDYKEIIYRRRKELHLSQKDLAKKVGISQNSMTSICRGKTTPTIGLIEKIMEALDMAIFYIPKELLR